MTLIDLVIVILYNIVILLSYDIIRGRLCERLRDQEAGSARAAPTVVLLRSWHVPA